MISSACYTHHIHVHLQLLWATLLRECFSVEQEEYDLHSVFCTVRPKLLHGGGLQRQEYYRHPDMCNKPVRDRSRLV